MVKERESYFNPLPPCGGRPLCSISTLTISKFQSTPSVWRETESECYLPQATKISIHSLRVEGDCQLNKQVVHYPEFQSTPSVWRETHSITVLICTVLFQSTPSVWRETAPKMLFWMPLAISIHSLRVEGDPDTLSNCRR